MHTQRSQAKLEQQYTITIPSFHVVFWVQFYDIPTRYMIKGESFGRFNGELIEYDSSFSSDFLRTFMRIRVCMSVKKTLKQGEKYI